MPRQSGAGRSTRNCRFVNRVVITYLGREIAEIQPSTVVSEHPMFAIPFRGGVKPVGSAEVPVGSAEVPVGSAEVKVT